MPGASLLYEAQHLHLVHHMTKVLDYMYIWMALVKGFMIKLGESKRSSMSLKGSGACPSKQRSRRKAYCCIGWRSSSGMLVTRQHRKRPGGRLLQELLRRLADGGAGCHEPLRTRWEEVQVAGAMVVVAMEIPTLNQMRQARSYQSEVALCCIASCCFSLQASRIPNYSDRHMTCMLAQHLLVPRATVQKGSAPAH